MIPLKKRLSLHTHPKRGVPFVRSEHFTVYRFSNQLGYNRLAVVVGKRQAPLATTRHRLKRQLLQAMNKWPDKSYDIILLPQKSYLGLKAKDRVLALSKLKINILA